MTPEDRNALSELEGRIAAMERRLRNARVARDSYVNFLKEKYPGWQPSTSFKTYEDTLVNRLLTSEYNWDEERDQRQRFVLKLKPRPLYENIPARGPLLTSDLERIRRRLTEISGQLRSIRETRLNLSTEDYLRSKINIEDRYDSNSSLMAIRSRLSDIALTTFEPVATPTSEQITNMKLAEEHDQYIAGIRAGRIFSSSVELPKPAASTTFAQPATVESADEADKSQIPNVQQEEVHDSNKPPAALEIHTQERRTVTIANEEPPQSQVSTVLTEPAAQIVPSRQPSVYQKMMGIFGNTNSSDTDDDISLQVKPPPRIVDTQASVAQPVVRQSSSSMLSHYLTAANSTAKDATSSDSDDDFFK
nr:Hypothetical protein CBG20524 [Haemonchus contortus]